MLGEFHIDQKYTLSKNQEILKASKNNYKSWKAL